MRLPSETKQQLFLKNLIDENPILFSGLGIFLAVAGTTTTEQAFFLGSVALALIIFNSLLASLASDILQVTLPLWLLVLVTATISSLFSLAFRQRMGDLPERTTVVLFLLAVSPAIYSRTQTLARHTSVDRALFDAAGSGMGIISVMMAIGFIRELLGLGRIGSVTIFARPVWPLMQTAAGGAALTALGIIMFRKLLAGRAK